MDTATVTAWMSFLVEVALFAAWILPIPKIVQGNIWAICAQITDAEAQEDSTTIKVIAVISGVLWPFFLVFNMIHMAFAKNPK
jgi:hypothetical protein